MAAAAAFRVRLAELGATLLEPHWLGNRLPHRVRCAEGHDCSPRPSSLVRGQGICAVCVGHDPATAEAAFRARLAELGATLLEPRYLGSGKPHRARCSAGHDCNPRPAQLQRGIGFCLTCAGNDLKAAEAAFRARLAELGATLLEPRWLGKDALHQAVCAEGHPCAPLPSYVRDGGGICRTCAGKTWDVLYVVTDEAEEIVKIGITSGDPRPRLAVHRRHGFYQVVRLLTNLPADAASELERTILAATRDVGEQPVRGREYFHARVLPLMLDLIDHHPAVRGDRARDDRGDLPVGTLGTVRLFRPPGDAARIEVHDR
ncbi:hypothetical protein [Streptomyces chrestomyceticus]|uniref:hypothetical protein n=1 Tax=Streptomyces chrestomyceticus TaxID=68185 RepID=UPI0033E23499